MKTSKQLAELHVDSGFRTKFIQLFSINTFFQKLLFIDDFRMMVDLSSCIILSDRGKALFSVLREEYRSEVTDSDLLFAIFMEFYQEELLIDVENCETVELIRNLSEQVLKRKILVPWVYDRLLYDRYFDTFGDNLNLLENEDVVKLLNNTPIGVFQVGPLIIGPFGILHSANLRYLPPVKSISLWHCSDHSCENFHSVDLAEGISIYGDLLSKISAILSEGKPSQYHGWFHDLINAEDDYYDINRIHESPLLILNCFGEEELRELLKHLIASDRTLRPKFPNDKRLRGDPMSIVSQLSKAECAHLILTADGDVIVRCLEEIIDSRLILIPPTEVRESDLQARGGFYHVFHQCNSLGVRSVPAYQNICLVRLLNLIEQVHDDDGAKADLIWKLMVYKKETFKETVENFILHEDPRVVVQDALLYGPRQTEKVLKNMYGNFAIPSNENEKNLLIDKVLWKLGFDINLFPTTLLTFWERLDAFRNIVSKCPESFGEKEKELVRGAGVNFYVLLEEILEKTLSFQTWLLLSDHFLLTKFRFVFEEARDFMCEKLNGRVVGNGDSLRFDNSGKNTLFPLVEGFLALTAICDEILGQDRASFCRDHCKLPRNLDSLGIDKRSITLNCYHEKNTIYGSPDFQHS